MFWYNLGSGCPSDFGFSLQASRSEVMNSGMSVKSRVKPVQQIRASISAVVAPVDVMVFCPTNFFTLCLDMMGPSSR